MARMPKFGFSGLSLLVGIILFAIQQGCSVTGTAPSWMWGTVWFSLAISLVVLAVWFWDQTASHHWIRKSFLTLIIGGVMAIFSYIPISKQYRSEHADKSNAERQELDITAFSSGGKYKKGAVIAGIPWIDSYSELRSIIYNRGHTDAESIDLVLHPDEPIAGIGQATAVPNVNFAVNTTLTVLPPQLVTLPSGETKLVQVSPLAFDGGYRVRCENLPRESKLEIVMAIARPSGNKGFAIHFTDGRTYWAKADIDGVVNPNEYFEKQRTATLLHVEGDYRLEQETRHSDRNISVIRFDATALKDVL